MWKPLIYCCRLPVTAKTMKHESVEIAGSLCNHPVVGRGLVLEMMIWPWCKLSLSLPLSVSVCMCVCGLGLENKSVVLASTAIQLLDERKSPIAAGKWELKRSSLTVLIQPFSHAALANQMYVQMWDVALNLHVCICHVTIHLHYKCTYGGLENAGKCNVQRTSLTSHIHWKLTVQWHKAWCLNMHI